jgi:hypothetical protein
MVESSGSDSVPAAPSSYDLFLSYHWSDAELAMQVYDSLTAAGYRVWFDRECIEPGQPWLAALEDGLSQVHTFLVLLSDDAPKRWVDAEVSAALRRYYPDPEKFRIVPLIARTGPATPASLGVFLDAFQRFELEFEDQLLVEDSLTPLIDVLRADTTVDEGLLLVDEPYRGLEVFRTQDQHLFFGRRRESADVTERIRRCGWVQVEGASGSGKSSLIRAGVMPALSRQPLDGHDDWLFLTMRPGRDPLKELAVALLALNPDDTTPGRLDAIETALQRSPQSLTNLVREWNHRHQPAPPRPVLLLVDQFEELFTQSRSGRSLADQSVDGSSSGDASDAGQTGDDPTDQFLALLLATFADKDSPLRIVTTIRSDFLHFVTAHEELSRAANAAERYALGPHSKDGLERAIRDPLKMAGGRIGSDELVERLVEDTESGPGRLPLLSHALRSLWLAARKRAEHTPSLSLADYEAIGGVGGAVTQSADDLFLDLTDQQQEAARRMFLQLVQVGRGAQDVRRTASHGVARRRAKLCWKPAARVQTKCCISCPAAARPACHPARRPRLDCWWLVLPSY